MSMAASVGMENKEGLKLLVLGGPRAQKMVVVCLFGSVAWIFSMVVLGGVTRLTRSGLSMTDWKFTHWWLSLADEEWLQEFDKYKQSPDHVRWCWPGFIGWWMMKSGLEEPPSEYAQPRVSPYRLVGHLTSVLVIYSGLFWTGLSVVMPKPPAESVTWVRGAAKVKNLPFLCQFHCGNYNGFQYEC